MRDLLWVTINPDGSGILKFEDGGEVHVSDVLSPLVVRRAVFAARQVIVPKSLDALMQAYDGKVIG